ncbi:MAG: aldo/keto reductase [Erysipelotrichaceae bacterium]|nr:aldo/keto reductase [Erysipelotrichaceae bacterium]
MKYRKFGNMNIEISALGFGCMRFPTTEDGKIDEEKAMKMLHYGINQGINYIDTAYMYHDYQSETFVGKSLQNGYREKVYLATKCPVFLMESAEQFEPILEEQLKKLQTDYIDFYLLHALSLEEWQNKVLKWNLLGKMEKAKQQGKIKHIGFSFHDDYEAFRTIVDGYDHWEFCQIQMNYVDVDHQATLEGLRYAASKGLGVIIMEPLLGGKLSNLPKRVKECLPTGKTDTEWALDFLWNLEEVSFLLSGMSSMKHVQDNIEYADRSYVHCLSDEKLKMFDQARDIFLNHALVGCTKCAYCMPCPFGLQIPDTFELYNQTAYHKLKKVKPNYELLKHKASECKQCHHCEQVCPQHLPISKIMKEIAGKFEE